MLVGAPGGVCIRRHYFIPMHCRDPLVKATRYFSRCLRCSGSNHRSGTKLYESGKIFSLWCMKTLVIPTGVWTLVNPYTKYLPIEGNLLQLELTILYTGEYGRGQFLLNVWKLHMRV